MRTDQRIDFLYYVIQLNKDLLEKKIKGLIITGWFEKYGKRGNFIWKLTISNFQPSILLYSNFEFK